jgi:hypothetical protein
VPDTPVRALVEEKAAGGELKMEVAASQEGIGRVRSLAVDGIVGGGQIGYNFEKTTSPRAMLMAAIRATAIAVRAAFCDPEHALRRGVGEH